MLEVLMSIARAVRTWSLIASMAKAIKKMLVVLGMASKARASKAIDNDNDNNNNNV